MAIQISLFNHKGGVSKTTTAFNLGLMLAAKGKEGTSCGLRSTVQPDWNGLGVQRLR